MQIKVEIKGLKQLQNNLRRYPQISAPIIQRAIDTTGSLVFGSVKSNIRGSGHPYKKRPYSEGKSRDTHMLNRIEQRKGALSVMIYPNVDYAIYPHEGLSTSKKYGRRPFMEDAVNDNKLAINRIFKEALDKITERLA